MRSALASACLFVIAAVSRTASAEFCDTHDPTGTGCHQHRVTYIDDQAPPGGGANAGEPNVEADYSDLDMRPFASRDVAIHFRLDVGSLNLVPDADGAELTLLELGIAQPPPANPAQTNDRVLSMTAVRYRGASWHLRFAWVQAPATWSIATPTFWPASELGSATLIINSAISVLDVTIAPEGVWQQLHVTVRGIDPNSGAVIFEQTAGSGFAMPARARNTPMRLRSGVIGGDLQRAGMATSYTYSSPDIVQ